MNDRRTEVFTSAAWREVEALLALRSLAGDLVHVTLASPAPVHLQAADGGEPESLPSTTSSSSTVTTRRGVRGTFVQKGVRYRRIGASPTR